MGDFEFDLSRSLKVKCNDAVGLSIYELLLMSHVYLSLIMRYMHMKIFSLSLIIGPKFHPSISKFPKFHDDMVFHFS